MTGCSDRDSIYGMTTKPEFKWDENLRDIPVNPSSLRELVSELESELTVVSEPDQRARILGEIGTYLRSLGELDRAEQKLREALEVVRINNLGLQREVQQKIRLGHVLQWQKRFSESDLMFEGVLETCRNCGDAAAYLAFALQHAGKNYFDQQIFDRALQLFKEALALRRLENAPSDQIISTETAIQRTEELLGTNEE